MTSFDFVLVLLLLFLAWRGWSRGIITQVASVVGLVVGSLAALRGSAVLAPAIPLQDPLRYYVAMALLFVGAVVAAYFIGRIVRGTVNLLYLGWLDHLIGLALGVVKCVLIAIVIIFVGVMISESTGHWVTQSFSGPFGVAIIKATEKVIPPNVCQRLHEQLAKFDAKVNTISNGASAEWTLPALSKGIVAEVEKAKTTLGTDVTNAVTQEVTKLASDAIAKESPALAGWFSTTTPAASSATSSAAAKEPAPAIVDELKSFVAAMVAPATNTAPASTAPAANTAAAIPAAVTSFWEAIAPSSVPTPVPTTIPTPAMTPPRFDPYAWAEALKR